LLAALLDGIERELPRALELRHRLHAEPELSHAEHRTAEAVAAELPVACETVAGTGRLARVGAGSGAASARPVAIRAELDGLPVKEDTGAPFSATGGSMHACGHDVHMAALVALARAAHALSDELPAHLLAVFQPSEEAYPSGAQTIAEDERFAQIDPAALVAAHVHPELSWGTVAINSGPVNASFDAVEIEIEGEPTHGAYPHRGRDPILALAETIVSLHAQLGRRADPRRAATLTIATVQGGSADNVIPGLARATGGLRAHDREDREALRTLAKDVVAGIASAHGCRGTLTLTPGEPALDNDAALVAGARELLGAVGLRAAAEWRSCGSDDLAFFGCNDTPLAMAFVGLDGADGFAVRPLHHPQLLVPDEAVGAIARVQAVLYVAAAARGAS
jgi:amidohydrolase